MNILQRIYEIHEIPTLPEILFKVHTLVNSDEGNAASLARIIEQDPALAAKVLKVANSSFYGVFNQRISSLSVAISRIGFNEVRNIVTAISLIKQFSKRSDILDYKMFWRHSLSAGYLMTALLELLPIESRPDRQICFLAGLLHDVGILIYDQFFHKEFETIMEHALQNEVSFLGSELSVAGKETHQMVGSALLEMWKIDASVVSGVRFHHYGLDRVPQPHRTIAQLTCLMEFVLCNCGIGSFEGTIYEIDKNVLESFPITSDTVMSLYKTAQAQVEKSDLIVAMGFAPADSGQLRSI
jgi:HD-like signal output (HDOD) protein